MKTDGPETRWILLHPLPLLHMLLMWWADLFVLFVQTSCLFGGTGILFCVPDDIRLVHHLSQFLGYLGRGDCIQSPQRPMNLFWKHLWGLAWGCEILEINPDKKNKGKSLELSKAMNWAKFNAKEEAIKVKLVIPLFPLPCTVVPMLLNSWSRTVGSKGTHS